MVDNGGNMSLVSKMEIMQAKAKEQYATERDVMSAAILELSEGTIKREDKLSKQIDLLNQNMRDLVEEIRELKDEVANSNRQNTIDVKKVFDDSAETVLKPLQTKVSKIITSLDKAAKLKEDDETNFLVKLFFTVVIAFAIGGYIANWLYGWWYDIPKTIHSIQYFFNNIR